jgi:hypothetical protein
MKPGLRHEGDYTDRQVHAAVVCSSMSVRSLLPFAMVVVGGWVPDLLFPDAERFYFSGGNICARRAAAAWRGGVDGACRGWSCADRCA